MNKNRSVMIGVFNSGYVIALLLFLAGSVGTLCDGVIASRGLGVAELAAVGLVYPYTKTMECISLLFSGGSQVVIGHKIGRNEFDEVSKVFYTSLVFTIVLAVVIAAAVIVAAEPVSRLLGASEAGGALATTADYLVSLAVGASAQLLTLYMIPLFQLDKQDGLVKTATVVMAVVNVALNVLFLMCGMGIKGIGFSTSISNYIALLILSTHLFKRGKGILLQGKFKLSGAYLAETVREGAPSAFKNVTSIVFNAAVNNIVSGLRPLTAIRPSKLASTASISAYLGKH
jgi:Na+-driven multidrug efflux pump